MINIKEFKSAIHKYDLERPNLYAVVIPLPGSASSPAPIKTNYAQAYAQTENGRLLTMFCRSTNLPGVNLGTVDAKRYSVGPTHKIPVGAAFSDVTMTFLSDASGITYNMFYNWINTIIPFSDGKNAPGVGRNFQLEFKENYQTDIGIKVYRGAPGKFAGSGLMQTAASVISAAAGVPFIGSLLGGISAPQYPLVLAKEVKLFKAYPTSISDLSLSYGSGDSVQEFTVSFTFYNWELKREPIATGSTGGGSLLGSVASFANFL